MSTAQEVKISSPAPRDPVTTLAESVYERLLEEIVSGQRVSGDVLSEVSLAKELKVSRTPVHDALRQLAKDGLVEQAAGRRARVAEFTRDDVFEIFELRKYLECPAAALAATRMDRRQLIPLREMAERLTETHGAANWLSEWIVFDEEFHDAIARASGNRRLATEIANYRLLHRGLNRVSTDVDALRKALDEHVAILNALESHDPAAARQAMYDHLETWQDYFVRNFPR